MSAGQASDAADVRGAARRARRTLGATGLLVALAAAAVLSLALGSRELSLAAVWQGLAHPDGGDISVIIHSLRVPRTILGLLCGAALGAAGALMQAHTRNPLADPGLLGVSAGASFAVVAGIAFLGVGSAIGYVWLAMVGAALASAAVFAIGSVGGRGPNPLTLLLAGTAVSALLGSLTTLLVLRDQQTLDDYRFWVVGSLIGRRGEVITATAPVMVVGLLLACAQAPLLNLLALGEDVARSLGQRVTLVRTLGLLTVVLLTGAATAACGPLAFLGLVVPHAVRALTGPDQRLLVPYAAAAGAVLLLAADVVGRLVARPGELQVGVVLALIGGPVLVALVRRRRLVGP